MLFAVERVFVVDDILAEVNLQGIGSDLDGCHGLLLLQLVVQRGLAVLELCSWLSKEFLGVII